MSVEDTNLLRTVDRRTEVAEVRGLGAPRAVAAIVLTLLVFALLWPTTTTLLEKWSDAVYRTYTHGALIVGIACFMLWRARSALASVPVQHSLVGLGATVLFGLLWLISYRAGLQIAHQGLLPLVIGAAICSALGVGAAREAALPVAYLYFAIPVWDAINPLLQWISTFAVRGMLRVIGIPTYFDGLRFQIPAGTFEIAGGCSGLHFVIVAAAIAVLYGEINRDSFRTRAKLLLLAVALAMITNWLRIAIIIIAGHRTQMQHYLVSGEHYSFGWGMFAVMMVLYFSIVRRWPIATGHSTSPRPATTFPALSRAGLILTIAALLVPALWEQLDANVASKEHAAAYRLPAAIDGWRTGRSPEWMPTFAGVDEQQLQRFSVEDRNVDAYVGIYYQQRQGKELSGFGNRPIGDLIARSRASVPDVWLQTVALDSAGGEWLVWSSYRIDSQRYTGGLHSQFAYGLGSLFGAPVSAAIVLRAACMSSCETARNDLARFAKAAGLTTT